jgi:hypothetical protein
MRLFGTLVVAAALLSGCGATEIDAGRAEQFVKGTFTIPPRSAHCPGGVEAKAGRTLTCQVVAAGGKRYRVVLHIVDGAGRVKFAPTDVQAVP